MTVTRRTGDGREVWLWLSNVALLLGLEVNAELAHERVVVSGLPELARPFVELRDTRKLNEGDNPAAAEAQAVPQK